MPIGSRCIIMGGAGPPLMNAGYNANYQIVQAPGYVMILTEMIHDARIIPLDNRPAAARAACGSGSAPRAAAGKATRWSSRRRTSTARTAFQGRQREHEGDRALHAHRRRQISYQFTVDDPATWARPWTAEMPMQKTEGPIFELACHEGNYGIANILAGARADEKKAAEAARRRARSKEAFHANEAQPLRLRRCVLLAARAAPARITRSPRSSTSTSRSR